MKIMSGWRWVVAKTKADLIINVSILHLMLILGWKIKYHVIMTLQNCLRNVHDDRIVNTPYNLGGVDIFILPNTWLWWMRDHTLRHKDCRLTVPTRNSVFCLFKWHISFGGKWEKNKNNIQFSLFLKRYSANCLVFRHHHHLHKEFLWRADTGRAAFICFFLHLQFYFESNEISYTNWPS